MSRVRLCCVGDSLTSGQGDARFLGWPGRIGRRAASSGHDCTVYNLGVRSDTSRDGAMRWKDECLARLPRGARGSVIFAFGINDATTQLGSCRVPLEETQANARSMLVQAKQLGWSPSWIGPAPVDEARQPMTMEDGTVRMKSNPVSAEYNDALRETAASEHVAYLDLLSALGDVPEWATHELTDGLHPTAQGYDRMSMLIWEWSGLQALLT
jgi:acyl-CoA thioesterase-1